MDALRASDRRQAPCPQSTKAPEENGKVEETA
jgi:hypothetical protein